MASLTQELPCGILYPDFPEEWFSPPAISNFGSGGGTEKLAFIFRVPKTGTLDKIGYRASLSVGGVATVRISIQGIDASGLPDTVISVFRTYPKPAGASGSTGHWLYTDSLTSDGTANGSKLAVNVGDLIAVVWDYTAYTTGYHSPTLFTVDGFWNFPYIARFYAGSWAKINFSAQVPNVVLKYTDDTYAIPSGCMGLDQVPGSAVPGASTLTTVSAPNEMGIMIQPPFDCRASAALVNFLSTAPLTLSLYDSSLVVLASTTWVTALNAFGTSVAGPSRYWFPFESVALTADQQYYLALKPTAAGTLSLWHHVYNSATELGASQGGVSGSKAYRTGSGAFTVEAAIKGLMSVVLDEIFSNV